MEILEIVLIIGATAALLASGLEPVVFMFAGGILVLYGMAAFVVHILLTRAANDSSYVLFKRICVLIGLAYGVLLIGLYFGYQTFATTDTELVSRDIFPIDGVYVRNVGLYRDGLATADVNIKNEDGTLAPINVRGAVFSIDSTPRVEYMMWKKHWLFLTSSRMKNVIYVPDRNGSVQGMVIH